MISPLVYLLHQGFEDWHGSVDISAKTPIRQTSRIVRVIVTIRPDTAIKNPTAKSAIASTKPVSASATMSASASVSHDWLLTYVFFFRHQISNRRTIFNAIAT